jgi:SAM-dependent methyltransferase
MSPDTSLRLFDPPRTDAVRASDDQPSAQAIRDRVLAYYTAATPDYKFWSRRLNMHFGYWRIGLNPFRREAMLHELNRQVLTRLQLPVQGPARLADLGGGTGATARAAVSMRQNLHVDVVTLIPTQVQLGCEMNAAVHAGGAITMHCADYTHTGLAAGAYDAVCMVESACHAMGPTKEALIREVGRLLKAGGILVMVDAVLLRKLPATGWFNRMLQRIYDCWCESWAVPELCRIDLLPETLAAEGFEAPKFEDWSWRVMPSIAHIPLLASRFMLKELIKSRGKLSSWRWRHIAASFLTPLLGLRRSAFAYAVVTARKRK